MSGSASQSSPDFIDNVQVVNCDFEDGNITVAIIEALLIIPTLMDAFTQFFNDLSKEVLPTVHTFPVPLAAQEAQGSIDMTMAKIEAYIIVKRGDVSCKVAKFTCYRSFPSTVEEALGLHNPALDLRVDCRSEGYKNSLPSNEAVLKLLRALPKSVLNESPRLHLKASASFYDDSEEGIYEVEFPLTAVLSATGQAHDPIVIED